MELLNFIPFILIFAIFYFFIFRPQAETQKAHAEMIRSLRVGQSVLMDNGIYGKITKISDHDLIIEIADNVKVKALKKAVASIQA